uniref:N-acetylneuraminate lyase n=1 Tax=Trichogramma kaykai TaxID=54128 RepID=A0ABD2VWI6_9HYME
MAYNRINKLNKNSNSRNKIHNQNSNCITGIVKQNTTAYSVRFDYKGLIAPAFATFTDEKQLNLDLISEYANYLKAQGIEGILVNGTSGELTSLSTNERKKIAEAWAKAVKKTKQHLMIQVGGTSLNEVIELAKHAENCGADSILCLPELYFKPNDIEELTNYLSIIGKNAPKTPLLYYHIPSMTHVNIHMGKFAKYVANKIPTLVGLKFTSSILEEAYEVMKVNENLHVFLGNDQLMLAASTMGIDSFIMTTLNFFQKPALNIMQYIKYGKDLEKAKESQRAIATVVEAITNHGTWVNSMKAAMNIFTDINVGPVREPLKNIVFEKKTLKKNIDAQFHSYFN